jgi:tRNA pseudouridine synthase 10
MEPEAAGAAAAESAAAGALRATEGWEFRTFLVGSTPPPGLEGDAAEAFRKAANRTLAVHLHRAWGGTRTPEFRRPELRLVVRFPGGAVDLFPLPLFVYGRYRKLRRGLPQSRFFCPLCHGSGCRNCGGKGLMAEGSVAEFLEGPLREAAGATAAAFRGCGREDADVRMLGAGRPFAVTLEGPRRRTLPWEEVAASAAAASAGAVEFPVLFAIDEAAAKRVSSVHPPKRYRARVEVEGGATAEDAARLAAALPGLVLAQRTPRRVQRRRADLVRERRILGATARAEEGVLEMEIRTEPGTYVKEMISGDEGRTTPSAAAILGRPCRCVELDVLEVEAEDPPRAA